MLSADLDGDEYTITPTLIEAIGRSPRDRGLDLLLERHGLGKLAAALTYAVPYVNGEMAEHLAARELDLQVAFAIAGFRRWETSCVRCEHTTLTSIGSGTLANTRPARERKGSFP